MIPAALLARIDEQHEELAIAQHRARRDSAYAISLRQLRYSDRVARLSTEQLLAEFGDLA